MAMPMRASGGYRPPTELKWSELFDSTDESAASSSSSDDDDDEAQQKRKQQRKATAEAKEKKAPKRRRSSLDRLKATVQAMANERTADPMPGLVDPVLLMFLMVCGAVVVTALVECFLGIQLNKRVHGVTAGQSNSRPSQIIVAHGLMRAAIYLLPSLNANNPDKLDECPPIQRTIPERCCYYGPLCCCCFWPTRLQVFQWLCIPMAILDIVLVAAARHIMIFCVIKECRTDKVLGIEAKVSPALQAYSGVSLVVAAFAFCMARGISKQIDSNKLRQVVVHVEKEKSTNAVERSKEKALEEKAELQAEYRARMARLRQIGFT